MNKIFDKTKWGLIAMNAVFISTITFSVKHVFDERVPTAATDGLTIMYNPIWFPALLGPQRVGLLAHETMHIALDHSGRRGNRDPLIWNMAADYVINAQLIEAGFELPPDGLYDIKYKGWTTEQVYDDLIATATKAPIDFNIDIMEPGSLTETIDAQGLPAPTGIQDAKNQIKELLVKAVTQAKMQGVKYGDIPGEALRVVDALINPKLDYTDLLERYMTALVKDDYSWRMPNRRYLPAFYLPSQYSAALGNIAIAVDTSGSIDDEDMVKILSEVEYIKDTFKPSILTIYDCDRVIHHTHVITQDNPISVLELEFSGGGGTNFQPVFDACVENTPDLLIYLTDLDAKPIEEDPGFPVIWLCYSKKDTALIGETIYYEK